MKLSLNIGTFAGIKVYVHSSFLLLLLIYGFLDFSDSGSLSSAIVTVSFIITVFICVTLHEFGHALTAARFGVKTQNITLYPFGGIAKLEKIPDRPWQEFLVAIAGPMVNVLIIILLIFGKKILTGSFPSLASFQSNLERFHYFDSLLLVNIIQVLFNMLPAFPMDGGRVLRSILAMFLNYMTATNIAANLGKVMAILFAAHGFNIPLIPLLPTSPLLLFIAFIVWSGASAEQSFARLKSYMGDIPIRNLMASNFFSFDESVSLSEIADVAAKTRQKDFPIVKNGQVIGMVYDSTLKQAQYFPDFGRLRVIDIMDNNFIVLQSHKTISEQISEILSSKHQVFPVISNGLLVGLFSKNKLFSKSSV